MLRVKQSEQAFDLQWYLRRARLLCDSYPYAEKHAGDTYRMAIAAILVKYPPEIAQECTDPRYGLASRFKYLPAVSEVATWCEEYLCKVLRLDEMQRLPPRDDLDPEERRRIGDRLRALSRALKGDRAAQLELGVELVEDAPEALEALPF
jgi:hypothetical protein